MLGYAEIVTYGGDIFMTTHDTRGYFFVLDGNDGSGKATQTELLVEQLRSEGREVLPLSFPRYKESLAGELVGEVLNEQHGPLEGYTPKTMSLFYAADRAGAASTIRAALSEGKVVIADRFTSSNQIHQGGKIEDEEERAAFLTWLDTLEHDELGIPRPDRIIYLKVPLEASIENLAQKRAAKSGSLADGELDKVESDRKYLERSHESAGWLLRRQPNWVVVDCVDGAGQMRSREEIATEIRECIVDLIPT